MSNEIRPALGEGAGTASGERPMPAGSRNVVHETYLLREQLLQRPRPRRQAAIIVVVCVLAVALVSAGFATFAALA